MLTMAGDSPVPLPPRAPRTLRELRAVSDGPPLSLRELSDICGFSVEKIRLDIDGGYLVAARALYGGRTTPYRVEIDEAKRYLGALGLL